MNNGFYFEIVIPNGDIYRLESPNGWDLHITRPEAKPSALSYLGTDGKWQQIEEGICLAASSKTSATAKES